MRTTLPVVLAIAIALTSAMFLGSGFDALVQASPDEPSAAVQAVNDSAQQVNENSGSLESRGNTDGSLFGFVLTGGDFVVTLFTIGLVLKSELDRMGFPGWFTTPVGWTIQLAYWAGVIQFITNRVIR